MQVGEVYRVPLDTAATWIDKQNGQKKMGEGTVVFVHPQGRFATLEFQGVHGKFRESFTEDQLTEKNRVLQKKVRS